MLKSRGQVLALERTAFPESVEQMYLEVSQDLL